MWVALRKFCRKMLLWGHFEQKSRIFDWGWMKRIWGWNIEDSWIENYGWRGVVSGWKISIGWITMKDFTMTKYNGWLIWLGLPRTNCIEHTKDVLRLNTTVTGFFAIFYQKKRIFTIWIKYFVSNMSSQKVFHKRKMF